MKTTTRKLRSPAKWHGGKTYLCRRFVDLFPEHDLYIEPFAGGLSTLLNKPPAKYEIVGDLNADLIRTWRTIRDEGHSLLGILKTTTYRKEHFETACKMIGNSNPVIHAVAFIVRNRMSRGGLGKDFAWSDRLRGGQPGDVNGWETFIRNDLPRVIERIQDVSFQCKPAIEVIEFALYDPHHECKRPLIYADPPYLHETRTHKTAYEFEMTREDHERLLSVLLDVPAKVFLSGYRSALYDEALEGWTRHEFPMPNHSGQGKVKQTRIECLWESPGR